MPSKQILRWGFLSTAKINRALVKPLHSSRRNKLVAIASRDLSRAQQAAQEMEIPKAYGSYEAMLADPDIDVIYNSLPNHMHAEWTIKAAQAGKHVLCEKPLAIQVEEVDAMEQAARQNGVVVAEAFMYLHHPKTMQVKAWVDEGLLGDLVEVQGSFTYYISRDTYRLDPTTGGGSLWDVGCYPISYARYIIGSEPVEVFGWQTLRPSGVDETFIGQMRFPGGQIAHFDSSFCAAYRTEMNIHGNLGSIHSREPYRTGPRDSVQISLGGKQERRSVKGQQFYRGEIEDMAEAVLDGKPTRIPLSFSRANIACILALMKSAQEDRPVSLTV